MEGRRERVADEWKVDRRNEKIMDKWMNRWVDE